MSNFTVTKKGVLKAYEGNDTDIVIPDDVKKIGFMAFYTKPTLRSVTIPGSVTEIEESAFMYCDGLEKVEILAGKPLKIGDDAFCDCKKLKTLELPDTVDTISETAFRGCEGLADESGNIIIRGTLYEHIGDDPEVTVADGVETIAAEAFKWNDKVEKVHLPDGVKTIGPYAFCGCEHLREVNIPDSVEEIGEFAFSNDPAMTDEDGFLIIRNSLYAYNGNRSDVVVPAGIEKIAPWAFKQCFSLSVITIPDSVTEIGNNAFYQCPNLSAVSLPKQLKVIDNGVFSGCSSLSNIFIPDAVKEIMGLVFYGCEGLTDLTIPEGVSSIGENAFLSCENLTHVLLPETLENLGDGAFKSCKNLKDLRIPVKVRVIGPNTFSGCSSLELIEAPEHLRKDIDNCFLNTNVKYYEGNESTGSFVAESNMDDEYVEVNHVVIKCNTEDIDAVRKIFEEGLAHFYLTGAGLDPSLYEKVLEEVRRNEALCRISTTEDAVYAEIADGIEAGEQLAWKLLNKNSFTNEFGSIACVGESILKEFPYADFSVVYQMQDISESTEKVWTEEGKIFSEWL